MDSKQQERSDREAQPKAEMLLQLARTKNFIEFAMVSKMSEKIQRGPSCLYIEPVTNKLIMKNGITKSMSFGFRNNSIENVKLIDFDTNGSIVGVYDKDMDPEIKDKYGDRLMVPYSQCVTRDMLHFIDGDGDGSGGDGSGGDGSGGSGSTDPSKPPIIAIQGKQGPRGYSAFEWWAREKFGDDKVDLALELEANGDALEINYMQYQFMAAIRGEDGEDGDDGEDGEDGKNGAKKSIWEWLWGGVDFVEDVISDGALSVLWGRVTALEVALGINSAGDAAQSGMNFLSLFGKGITNKIDNIADTISFIGDNIDSVKGICDTITEPLVKTSDFITEITNKPGKMSEFFGSIKDLFKSSGSGYVKLPEFGSLPSPVRTFKSTVPVTYSLNVMAETTDDSKSPRTSSDPPTTTDPPTEPEEPPPKDDPWDIAGWEKPDMETIKNAIDNITWKEPKPVEFNDKDEVEAITAELVRSSNNTKFIYNTFQPKYEAFAEMYTKEQNRYKKEYDATASHYDDLINALPPEDPSLPTLKQEKDQKLKEVNDGSVEILQTITEACAELKDQKETAVSGNFVIVDTLNGHPISDYALKSDIGETENIQELKDTIKQQQAKIDELTVAMQALMQKMEEHQEYYNPKVSEMWAWYSDIGKYIEDFNFCEMQALRDKVNEVYAWYEKNGALSIEEFNEIKALVDNIRDILDQHESQLLNLNTNVECFKTDVNGLLDQLTAKLNELISRHDEEISTINEKVDTNTDTINNLSFIEQNKYINQHYRLSYRNYFASTQVPVNGIISEEHVGKRIDLSYNIYFNDTNTITNDSNIIGDITWIWEKDGQEVATAVCRKHSKSGWWGELGTYQFPQCAIKVTQEMVGCPTKPNKYRFVVIPQSQTIKDTLPNFASHISEYVDELKTDLTTIQSDLSELTATNSSEHAAINERIDNLTTSNDNNNSATNSEIAAIKQSITELTTTNSSEHETINNTLTANEARLSSAETSISELTSTNSSEHETINNTLTANETRLQKLELAAPEFTDSPAFDYGSYNFKNERPITKFSVNNKLTFWINENEKKVEIMNKNFSVLGDIEALNTVTANNIKADNETRLAKLESIIYPIGCIFTTNKKGGYPSIGSWSLSGLIGCYTFSVRGAGLNIYFNNQEIKAVVVTNYAENGANVTVSGFDSITTAKSYSGMQAFERSNYGIKINYNTKCVAEYKDNTLTIDPNYGSNQEWSTLVTAIFHGFKAEPTADMFVCNGQTATKCEPVGEISYIYKRNS